MNDIALKPLVTGDFTGTMMVSTGPLSFFGDVDVLTGKIVSGTSDLRGQSMAGIVLCLPFTHGSAGAWRVLQQLRTHGTAPDGIVVNDLPDPTLIQGAILANIPVVRPLHQSDFSQLISGEVIHVTGAVARINTGHGLESTILIR